MLTRGKRAQGTKPCSQQHCKEQWWEEWWRAAKFSGFPLFQEAINSRQKAETFTTISAPQRCSHVNLPVKNNIQLIVSLEESNKRYSQYREMCSATEKAVELSYTSGTHTPSGPKFWGTQKWGRACIVHHTLAASNWLNGDLSSGATVGHRVGTDCR